MRVVIISFTIRDPRVYNQVMTNEIQCFALLKIKPGKLDEFKRLNAKCSEIVRTMDTGTLQYESYMNQEETKCMVFERYRDSQSLLDHHKHLGETMAQILETCEGSGGICGIPSSGLADQIKKSSVVQIYSPLPSNLEIDELRS